MIYECHGTDTQTRVGFYERDFYPLSNFSSFAIESGHLFPTSEHYYHYLKFQLPDDFDNTDVVAKAKYNIASQIGYMIIEAKSAHAAYQIAQEFKAHGRPDWDDVKLNEMRYVLRIKVEQHQYVRRKLLATGDRELVEDSWRDTYWGAHEDKDGNLVGENWLGKLWMELREEIQSGEFDKVIKMKATIAKDMKFITEDETITNQSNFFHHGIIDKTE